MPGFPQSDGIQGCPVTGTTPRSDSDTHECVSRPIRYSFDLASTSCSNVPSEFRFRHPTSAFSIAVSHSHVCAQSVRRVMTANGFKKPDSRPR